MKSCENCGEEHDGEYGSGRFCSSKCARSFSTKAKRKEINEKVSTKMTGRIHSDETRKKISEHKNINYWQDRKRSEETKKKISDSRKKYTGKIKEKHCKICKKIKNILVYGSICNDCKEPFRLYRDLCTFKFNVYHYPNIFDLSLIEKYGWYSPSNSKNPNLNGISRDHIFSVAEGFRLGVDPKIISHIANCNLIRHNENAKKNTKCDITIEELLEKIKTRPDGPIG